MIEITKAIAVRRPINEAFRVVSDFSFIEQWDPGVVSSQKVSDGPVGVGTAFALSLRYGIFSMRMVYTITEYHPPFRVVLKGTGDSFAVTDTIKMTESGSRTTVTYTARFDLPDMPPRLAPVVRPLLERIARAAMDGMKTALSPCPGPPRSVSLFHQGVHPVDAVADRLVLPGALGFSKWGHSLAKPFWRPDTELLTGKTVVLTGPTSGLGKAAALGLARRDARLILIARNRQKALATSRELTRVTGNHKINVAVADLSIMAEVHRVADEILLETPCIDVLINNAGALFPQRETTDEGLERTFATNLLGVFTLTRRLLPALCRAKEPRILNVASGGMYTQKIHVDDLEMERVPYDGPTAYAWAKRGLVILTEHWAGMFRHRPFAVHAMHPGWVDTPGLAASLPQFHKTIRPLLRTPAQGADTLVWLAAAQPPGRCSGLFWLDRRPHGTHVFPGTRESEDERRQLFSALESHEHALRRRVLTESTG
ncbi:SDR family NAD(P)-dependent oxidoreductase [Desulfoluna butyratoxydans]|uniref:Polyketide cyclase / dehydrase and lipid transport n=1 Tax=Desulfoluna butyratoxydans TaxID=231438 RepID=A0A4U8YNF5_9BACT|nr:SDR family NAD(P)-dependent oxidoreductase [Desulfoluna butyratoxydans]VFQ42743.1 polyketide cyclase / dehydrase and lipid transport [Desulfoluna butyratoxydans]